MRKKLKITQGDITTFHQAVQGTKPLIHNKIRLTLSPPATPASSEGNKPPLETFSFGDTDYLTPVKGDEFIEFRRTSISYKILRKLRKGQYNVTATLDLHKMRVDEAKIAVDCFLQQCLDQGIRVVRIIHGKGHHSHTPVLKNKLNHWLREIDQVLAFCSATPADGNRGALYVLLRNVLKGGLS